MTCIPQCFKSIIETPFRKEDDALMHISAYDAILSYAAPY